MDQIQINNGDKSVVFFGWELPQNAIYGNFGGIFFVCLHSNSGSKREIWRFSHFGWVKFNRRSKTFVKKLDTYINQSNVADVSDYHECPPTEILYGASCDTEPLKTLSDELSKEVTAAFERNNANRRAKKKREKINSADNLNELSSGAKKIKEATIKDVKQLPIYSDSIVKNSKKNNKSVVKKKKPKKMNHTKSSRLLNNEKPMYKSSKCIYCGGEAETGSLYCYSCFNRYIRRR